MPSASDVMSGQPPARVRAFDPENWRSPSDGPRWLYAAPGRLRAIWRLTVFGLAIAVMQPVAESFLAPLFGAISRGVGERVEAYPWITMVSIAGALTLALRFVDHAPWRNVALDTSAWRVRTLAVGLALGTCSIGGTFALLWISGAVHFSSVSTSLGVSLDPLSTDNVVWSSASWSATALRLAAFLAPAALWEELLFRGYLWTVAEDAGGVRLARWSTAVAFGAVHLMNPGANVISTALVVLAGFCLGAIRERSGSLAAAWMAHFAWNWVMAALLHVPVSGVPFDTPGYRTTITGPAWWTGGSWGPEGGAAALLVLGTALLFSMRPMRRTRLTDLSGTETSSR